MMTKMGFGCKWISWISWCISSTTFSVMANGSPSGFFRSSRGLMQGGPLPSYLFMIGMEALSCLIPKLWKEALFQVVDLEEERGLG